jgi:hypothetical protein
MEQVRKCLALMLACGLRNPREPLLFRKVSTHFRLSLRGHFDSVRSTLKLPD